jgi:signal transduction histidine kinase
MTSCEACGFHVGREPTAEAIAEIAHDLGNLFTCILCSASAPQRGRDDLVRHLDAIACAAQRGAELLRVLRSITPEGRQTGSVSEAFAACGVLLERVGAAVGVEVRVSADEARVPLAPHELQQIVINLGLNAIEAMSRTGGRLELGAAADDECVAITVGDTGPGIEPARVATLFEPGRSTKCGHAGLGLALVKRLVRGAAGTIRVDSVPGAGTRFVIELPLAEAAR